MSEVEEKTEQEWAAAAGAARGQVDRMRRDTAALIAGWRESADALEELSKIENGNDISETVQGATSAMRRCASQLSSVIATPLETATAIASERAEPSAQ